jgi:hypothetical protein
MLHRLPLVLVFFESNVCLVLKGDVWGVGLGVTPPAPSA